jgi:hypothetical protein
VPLRYAPPRYADGLNSGAVISTVTQEDGGQILLADGTVGAPSLAFKNNTSMGRYRGGANDMREAINGAEQLRSTLASIQSNSTLVAAGALIVVGNFEARAEIRRAGDGAPAALGAGNVNNWTGNAGRAVVRVTPDGGGTSLITGIVPVGADGDELFIYNIGAANMGLAHQNVASTDVNRILTNTAATLTIVPDGLAYIWYDPVATRWRGRLVNT